jgi:hypothetical protein
MHDPTPSEERKPEDAVAEYARRLAAAIESALEGWVHSQVGRFGGADLGRPDALVALVDECRAAVLPPLRALLDLDIDAQRSTPLTEVGRAVAPVTAFLDAAGVAPVVRDAFDAARDPADVYGVTPRTWSDLGAPVAEAGMTWGAAKAYLHLARRRS